LVFNGPIYLFIKTWALLMAKRLYVFIRACFVDPLVLGLVGPFLDTLAMKIGLDFFKKKCGMLGHFNFFFLLNRELLISSFS
jgi:hypothetical protein